MTDTFTSSQLAADRRTASVLEHVGRYRLTTFDALRRLESLATRRPRELRRVIHKCVAESLVASAWLHQGMRYWHLTPGGAARLVVV